jgi:hypothetical protein
MAEIPVHKSSGNVFIDIGFTPAEAAEFTAKSRLITAIDETIKRRKLTQLEARAAAGRISLVDPRSSAGGWRALPSTGSRLGLPRSAVPSKSAYARTIQKQEGVSS